MKKKAITVFLIFLSLSFIVTDAWALPTGTWTTKAALPDIRADLPGVGYNGMVYVFGGYHDSWSGGQAEVFAYNPSTDSWTQKASMSYARWGSAAAVYNSVAYVFGGDDGANDNKVEAYSFASNGWTIKNNLPDNLAGQGEMAVTVGSLIYVFGGWSGTSAYSYNPSTDTYTQLPNNPFRSRWGTCAYVNVNGEDRIYIMGGFDDYLYGAVNTIYYYRPSHNDWTYVGTTPYAAYGTLRDDPVISGIIYYGYGHAGGDFYSYLYSFNPSTGVWTQLPSGVYPRDGVACGVVGGKLYVVGGRNADSSPILGLDYNEQFDTGTLTVSIGPTRVRMYVNQSQTFTSSVSGGTPPYTYQWYRNGTAVSGATGSTWTFTPTQTGQYNVYANVTDSLNKKVQSNIVNDILVYDQSTASPLVPDWSNVTQDFFKIVPGAVNPVLTGDDVTDRTGVDYVADPFMFHENNTWYMFFEVSTNGESLSEIGLATSSNGFSWTYKQIVLSEPFSLAYPYVFKWDGTYYLIPETYSQNEVRLYKATNFPYSWTLVSVLISGQSFIPVDSSIFRYDNTWWMFTGDDSNLYLFYSYNLTDASSWHMTPNSPIVANDPSEVRGGGRVIVFDDGRIIRLTQKGDVSYGEAVRAFEVGTLTQTSFAEHEVTGSPLVEASGSGWNSWAMHTVDPWWTGNSWLAVVDGGGDYWWSIGIYVTPLNVTISPTQVRMFVNQSQTFTSSVSGGTPPYTYRWYRNGRAVPGATSPTWTFTPTQTGHYNVYVNVTDSLNKKVQSNIVNDILVNNQLSVSISPTSANITLGGSQQFNSTVTGGFSPYTYQWCLNNTVVPNATSSTWTFNPTSTGHYKIYLNVTDVFNNKAQSNIVTNITVLPSPYNFSIMQITDTQFLASTYPDLYNQLTTWIVNNNATYKLKMVVHTGDLTDQYYDVSQWQNANDAMTILTDGGIPYTWCAGNHDQNGLEDPNAGWVGNQYAAFDPATFRGNSYWVGDSIQGKNTAVKFSVNGYNFLIINLECQANATAMAWATNLLNTYSSLNYNIIVATHAYLDSPDMTFNNDLTYSPTWEQNLQSLLNNYPKVFMTLNGHTSIDPAINVHNQVNGRTQIEFNDQYNDNDQGACSARIYSFDLNNQTVTVTTYSVWDSTWLTQSQDSFSFSTNLTSIPTVSITPTLVRMDLGQSQTFSSSVSGGRPPYSYQWYLNDTAVLGATSQNWTFTPTAIGHYKVYVNLTDGLNIKVQSNNVTDIIVYPQLTTSISPVSVNMTINTNQQFTSNVTGGLSPYSYQWYLNSSQVQNATGSTWTFNSTTAGTYIIYLRIADNSTGTAQSNNATARVETPMTVTITPTQVKMYFGQTQTFSSSVSGGTAPYVYQWYLNDTAVSGATSSNWNFTPTSAGSYMVYLNVTDALNLEAQSNIVTDITVYSQLTVSITPVSVNMTVGGSQTFNSTVTGGSTPYTYQWYYTNGTAITGATTSTLTFKANSTGTFSIYLNVTDNLNYKAQSNTAAINVYSQPTVTISPTQVTLYYGQSQTFSASVTGGITPYTYQWYVNDTAVAGATNDNYMFTPRANGNYRIHANVTDSLGSQAKSNIVGDINVYSAYLMLNTEPQATYPRGQQVTFKVTVMNQQNPRLETSLALTITGPGGYSFYDFQPINVTANGINEYSFNWVVPNVAGTYIVETSLVPAQLTAYDAKWLQAVESPTEFAYSHGNSLVVSKSLMNEVYALFVLVGSQALSVVYCLVLPKFKGKKLRTFSRALPLSRTNILSRLTWRLHSKLRMTLHG